GTDYVAEASRVRRELSVGALPIGGEDNRLQGMLTDRDIVVACVADGGNPNNIRAGSYGGEKPVTIGADDPIDEAIKTMQDHQVRRLPVIDGDQLIGIVAQADIARSISEDKVGDLVKLISS